MTGVKSAMHTFTKIRNYFSDKKQVRLSRSVGGDIGIILFLVLICVFMILPILYSVIQSLKPIDEIFLYPPRFFVKKPTFGNYKELLTLTSNFSIPFSRYVFNSLLVSVLGTAVYVLIAAMAGYALAKGQFRGKALFSVLVVWALLFRGEVTAIPAYFIVSELKMLDTYWAMILPAFASSMGVFLVRQFATVAISNETIEAARIDGAGEGKIFFSIGFPSIKPALLTIMIFQFQGMWNGGGGAQYIFSEKLKLLPTVMSTIAAGGIARAGAAAAVAVVMMIPPIIVFLISQSSIMETMTESGLK